MSSTFQSAGARRTERRYSPRQRVLFACIQLDDDNGGLILDISERGLSLQAVAILAHHELGRMHFQLSPSQTWIDTRGRIVWIGASSKTAGVEFIGLADEARNQIKHWISLELQANEPVRQITPKKTEPSKDESENVIPFPESEAIEPVAENQSRHSIAANAVAGPPSVEKAFQHSRVESTASSFTGSARGTTDPRASWFELEARINRQINARERAGFSGTSGRLIGVTAGAVLLLSVLFFLLGHQLRKSKYSQQHGESESSSFLKVTEPSSDNAGNPANSAVDSIPSSNHLGFLLQVGAMTHKENADALAGALQRNFPAFVSRPRTGRFYRVFVGPYSDPDSTLKAEEELKEKGFEPIRTPWNPPAKVSQPSTDTSAAEAIFSAKVHGPSTDTSASPTNVPVDQTPPSERPRFILQVAAMTNEENADALAEDLQRRNFPAGVSPPGTGRFYRVVVGPYSDADSALRAEEELKKEGFESIRTPWKP